MPESFLFRGRVVMVTGGSVGIGRAIAMEAAMRGATVVIVSRGEQAAMAVVRDIQQRGGTASWEQADMLVFADMKRAVANTVSLYGRIDGLVASGSPGRPVPRLFVETDPDDYIDYFTTRTTGRMNALRAVIDPMRAQGKGKVVFITTDAGRVPTPSESINGAAAAGLIFFTRAVGRELARFGIRVNAISTTLTRDTPPFERYMTKRKTGDVLAKAFSKIEDRAPFGLNRPTDLAEMAMLLLSDGSDQISGATVSINGGISFPG